MRVLVVASAWALAHHEVPHHAELTDLGWQRAAEAVGLQVLRWGGERTKHESVQWRVWIRMERDNERECTALRRVTELIVHNDGDGRVVWLHVIGMSSHCDVRVCLSLPVLGPWLTML